MPDRFGDPGAVATDYEAQLLPEEDEAVKTGPFQRRQPLEKEIQRRTVKLLRTMGVDVATTSQVRPSMVTLGMPDLYLMHAAFGAAWLEVKRPGGKQSPQQLHFQERCIACRVPYIIGGYRETLAFLIERGLWRLPEGVTLDSVAGEPWKEKLETEEQYQKRITRPKGRGVQT